MSGASDGNGRGFTDGPVNEAHEIEAKRARWELDDFLYYDDEWTWRKIESIFMSYFPNRAEIRATRQGILDMLDEGHDLNDDVVRDYIMTAVVEVVNETMETFDHFTRVSFMGTGSLSTNRAFDFHDLADRFYVHPLLGGGKFGYISGSRSAALGVGKTDFAVRLIGMLLNAGECVLTNIEAELDHPGFHRVISLKQMIKQAILNLMCGKTTVVILDEVPQFLVKERGTSKDTVSMNQLSYLFRKMGITLVVISQLEKKVPTNVADMSIWHVQKLAKELMFFRKKVDGVDYRYFIKNVPRTDLKFITGESASFNAEFDVKALHDYIVSREEASINAETKYDGKSQLQVILEYLELDVREITKADLKVAAKVLTVRSGMVQKDVAYVLGVTQGTISNWLKEMGIKPVEA
jgi:hypothetical protein